MGFFKSYDNVDNAVNRAYGRWAKWIWGSLLVLKWSTKTGHSFRVFPEQSL